MNHFLLSPDHSECARWHVDFHSKMILESAQLLCSAHEKGSAPYKPTHLEHPCSRWVRLSLGNYRYLIRHAQALVQEFSYRGTEHASSRVIDWCATNEPQLHLNGVTGFALAMPDQYRGPDAFESYRQYYLHEKQGYWRKSRSRTGIRLSWIPASWKRRNPPPWWKWLPVPKFPNPEQMKKLKLITLNGVELVYPGALQPLVQ